MRILYVITKANWGGAQRYVYDLATAAKAAGHEVAVAAGGRGPLTERLAAAGVRVVPLPLRQHRSLVLDLLTFGSLLSLIRLFRGERPEVVHVNSAKAGGLGALAARLAGVKKIIFTAHGWAFNESRAFPVRIAIRFFSWLTVLLSTQTICVSEAIARDAAWMPGGGRKLVVIRNGVASAPLVPRELARSTLLPGHEQAFWIGMLSELHPTKRVEDAIEAFAKIAHDRPNVILVVCGEGAERTKLEALIHARGLSGRVFLPGFVANAPEKLLAFDLFLHTAQSEALGYAILEAGSAALPVVATAVGGVPEVIEPGVSGVLVPARNVGAIAGALLRLIEGADARRQFGAALRAKVARDFTKEAMLSQTLARYSS